MIINSVLQNFIPRHTSTYTASGPHYTTSPSVEKSKYPNLAPLAQDTVSFGAAKIVVKPRGGKKPHIHSSTYTFEEALIHQFVLNNPELTALGRVYHAVLKDIAANNPIFKVCENIEHLVKSPESMAEKIRRSGNMKVPDTIRSTVFYRDLYNFENLLTLLSEMKESGYIVHKVPVKVSALMDKGYFPFDEEKMISSYLNNPKDRTVRNTVKEFFEDNGYDVKAVRALLDEFKALGREPNKEEFLEAFSKLEKMVPDIDIRLQQSKVTPEQVKKLPEMLRYCISSPQSSGYEDIQIRFVREYVNAGNDAAQKAKKPKDDQVPHELIVLFGENYYKAKTRESEFVYSHLRKFDALTVKRYLDRAKFDDVTEKLKATISSVERLFRREVSSKEFRNAKNLDYVGSNVEEKIIFTEEDKKALDTYHDILLKEINLPYKKAKSKMRQSRRYSLDNSRDRDIATINEIYNGLKDTIEKYNSGEAYHLTDPIPEAPKKVKKGKKPINLDTQA